MVFVKKIIGIFTILLIVNACRYSFTGSSVPPHIKTIAIPLFKDNSGAAEANLSDDFTNLLIKKFLDDNSLQVTNKSNANALLIGSIVSLNDMPNVLKGGQDVTSRRITITVNVTYRDLVKRKIIFKKEFSDFGDYSTEVPDITEVRKKAIEEAINKITDDILLAVVSNW